jgi:hypothetical protein
MDKNLGTPMIRVHRGIVDRDFYVEEPAMLDDGLTLVWPTQWYMKDSKLHMLAHPLHLHRDGWLIDETVKAQFSEDRFLVEFPDLKNMYLSGNLGTLPDPSNIIG